MKHDKTDNSAQEEDESIDEASQGGILTVGTATAQQTRRSATKTWDPAGEGEDAQHGPHGDAGDGSGRHPSSEHGG